MPKREQQAAALSHEAAVVPHGEGPLSEAVTVRLPKKLLEFIERTAKETENNRSDTILHLLRWARDAYEKKGTK